MSGTPYLTAVIAAAVAIAMALSGGVAAAAGAAAGAAASAAAAPRLDLAPPSVSHDLGPVPPSVPQNLIEAPFFDSQQVYWQPPADNAAEVTGYAVAYVTGGTVCPSCAETIVDASQYTVGLLNVMPGSTSTWAVSALSPEGDSPWVAADGNIDTGALSTGWADWSPPSVPPLSAVACGSSTSCVAVGAVDGEGVAEATDDSGTSWTAGVVPAGVSTLSSVSCPSATECLAAGGAVVLRSDDAGASWSTQTVPLGAGSSLEGIDCVSTDQCVAVGRDTTSGTAPIIQTTDGGAAWTPATVPSAVLALSSVACPSSSTCLAVGSTTAGGAAVIQSVDGGQTWSSEPVPAPSTGGTQSLASISCGSASQCVAVGSLGGSDALATTDGGSTWTAAAAVPANSGLSAVTCTTASDCTAVGQLISGYPPLPQDTTGVALVTSDGGTTWGSQDVPNGSTSLGGIACWAPTSCLAVGSGETAGAGAVFRSVDAGGPTVTTTAVAPGTAGTPYSATLAAAGGTGPSTWAVSGGAMPAGLALDPSTATISGTPRGPGASSFTVTVTDADGLTASTTLVAEVSAPPGNYTALSPTRICDTRAGNPSGLSGPADQCLGRRLAPLAPLNVAVGSDFEVPSTATAVTVNVTAVDPAANGYLTVYPGGSAAPTASNVNFAAGAVVSNLVEVELPADGDLSVVANTATDVVIDLEGYVAPPSAQTGTGLFEPLATPARICDTRAGNPSGLAGSAAQCAAAGGGPGTLRPGQPIPVQVAGVAGVPASGVAAVVMNVTAVGPSARGYLSVFPGGQPAPTASNLNFGPGQTVPNRVMVPVSAGGAIEVVANVSTDVLVDVSGWFSSGGTGTGSQFTPEPDPARICDTRAGNPSQLTGSAAQCNGLDQRGMPLGTAQTSTIQVSGLAEVPAGATAVVLNVTAVAPTAQTHLTVFSGTALPGVSDLNPATGQVVANLVVISLSTHGGVTVYNYTGSVNVVIDVAGWYTSTG